LVLYWIGCALAVAAVLLGVSAFTSDADLLGWKFGKPLAWAFWIGAALLWFVGRWLRFNLSARIALIRGTETARSASEEASGWGAGTDDPP